MAQLNSLNVVIDRESVWVEQVTCINKIDKLVLPLTTFAHYELYREICALGKNFPLTRKYLL